MKKILCMFLCLGMLLGCSSKQTENTKIQETEIEKEIKEYKEILDQYSGYESGTYEVGKDIDAGEYCLFADRLDFKSNSYTVRDTEYDEGQDTLAYKTDFFNSYITLKEGDFIEFESAKLFKSSSMPEVFIDYPYIVAKVGKDIEAGNYIIKPLPEEEWVTNTGVYFSVYNPVSTKYNRNEIVINDIDFTGNKKIKLKDGQYLEVENCTFEKVD